MEREALSCHKKYQPDRTDILWNTDWGVPCELVSKEEAALKGLRRYKRRWVTKEERKLLRDQRMTYMFIRTLSVLQVILFVPAIVAIIVGSVGMFGTHTGVASAGPRWGQTLGALLWTGTFLLAGIFLYRFRRWARTLSAFFLLSLIPISFLDPKRFSIGDVGIILLVTLVLVYLLYRGPANLIFTPRKKSAGDQVSPR